MELIIQFICSSTKSHLFLIIKSAIFTKEIDIYNQGYCVRMEQVINYEHKPQNLRVRRPRLENIFNLLYIKKDQPLKTILGSSQTYKENFPNFTFLLLP